MWLELLASSLLILATASANAGSGPSLGHPSDRVGLWSRAASLATGREEHTATLLGNGTVLVAGGTNGRGTVLASAELYDPRRNRWTSAGSMAATRIGHTATLLAGGTVLVTGGLVMPFPAPSLASTERYDPATNKWSPAAPMLESRTRHTATLLPDGRVLVVGGETITLQDGGLYPGRPRGAEIYDPQANRWSATAPMGISLLGHTATLLADGRVLVTGGQDDAGAIVKSTEIYDPADDRWISAAPIAVARTGHVAVRMANHDVLVAGGQGDEANASNVSLASAELYDPQANAWVTVAGMADFLTSGTVTLLRNGMVLVVGATDPSNPELYDSGRNRWSRTGPSMARYHHTATRLPDGRVLIAGGYPIEALNDVLIYDPAAVAPAPRTPPDPRRVAALLLTLLFGLAAGAWSLPAVRLRVQRWRPPGQSEEWIT